MFLFVNNYFSAPLGLTGGGGKAAGRRDLNMRGYGDAQKRYGDEIPAEAGAKILDCGHEAGADLAHGGGDFGCAYLYMGELLCPGCMRLALRDMPLRELAEALGARFLPYDGI